MAEGRSILLIVGGGIAAYKSLELIRLWRKAGLAVTPVLTAAGTEFVTALSLAALAESPVYQSLFDLKDETEMGHIQLSRKADLVVVAPATADLMAKMAAGLAGDLATTLLLATDKPVLIAPAMNVRMWHHPATARNLATLRSDGVAIVGPNEGAMACGEYGLGRMAEPDEIAAAAEAILNRSARIGPLAGQRVLITSGPTREAIDPVRYISNHSSGKQGLAIAEAARDMGARVTLISGPTGLAAPHGIDTVWVETADEMLEATRHALPADIAIFAAAVADWRVASSGAHKTKKQKGASGLTLDLVENPDILATIGHLPKSQRPKLVIGFAAETQNVIAFATAKLAAKGADWILANDVSPSTGTFGGNANAVTLLRAGQAPEPWPHMSKRAVADRLCHAIAETIAAHETRG